MQIRMELDGVGLLGTYHTYLPWLRRMENEFSQFLRILIPALKIRCQIRCHLGFFQQPAVHNRQHWMVIKQSLYSSASASHNILPTHHAAAFASTMATILDAALPLIHCSSAHPTTDGRPSTVYTAEYLPFPTHTILPSMCRYRY